jgi:nucleotide-binding universal stress UspA family protein
MPNPNGSLKIDWRVKMYNRILAPLDGSKLAECALGNVADIASGCHVTEVILLTVLEPVLIPSFWPDSQAETSTISANLEKSWQQAHRSAGQYLAASAENMKKAGIAVETVVIDKSEGEQVADIILNYARNNSLDMIVMSTHGRSGISRWAFGSVAEKVVRSSLIPVLTVTPLGCRA